MKPGGTATPPISCASFLVSGYELRRVGSVSGTFANARAVSILSTGTGILMTNSSFSCPAMRWPVLRGGSHSKMTSFVPTSDAPVQLLGGRRWLAVLGSVGQPRDGDPAASFAMLDTISREITYCRVPYDVEAAADRIRANGLPHWLADRLLIGK